ncbi:hypothetical protein J6590_077165 [Homalodisca vitripennis]|nr:hypothetical protein J6590_077165 [Homalodisca vitripennis]
MASDLLSLSRSVSSRVIGLITGHGHLRKHIYSVGILQEDPLCRMCDESVMMCDDIRECRCSSDPRTGQWPMRADRIRLKRGSASPFFKKNQDETAEHLLFDCPSIPRERYAILGSLDKGGKFLQEDLIGCFRRFVELLKS